MASSAALLRISIGAITRRGVALARTTAGLLIFAFAAADTELFAAGFSTNIAGTTCEPMGEIGANSLLPGAIIVADLAMEAAAPFSNDTSRGASENTIRQAIDIPVNKNGAGLHTRLAPARFSSKLSTPRGELWRMRDISPPVTQI